jgi:hypothetical protein
METRMSDFESIVGATSNAAEPKSQRRRHATAAHLNRVFTGTRVALSVDRSRYFLSDLRPDEVPGAARYSGETGVISTQPSIAAIWTGTHSGKVGVTVYWRHDEPELPLEGWDEVVEIDMRFEGEATLFGAVLHESSEIPPLPADAYRLRVHTRGRDLGHEEWIVDGDPVEEHLLIAWPTPNGRPPVLHRLADAFGAMLRQRVRPPSAD